MKQRHFSFLMVLLSAVGAAGGFFLGHIIADWLLPDGCPGVVRVALFFGIVALCVALMCIVSEMIYPRLTDSEWRKRYSRSAWALWVPCTLIGIGLLSGVFQLIYGIQFTSKLGGNTDYCLVIDESPSMFDGYTQYDDATGEEVVIEHGNDPELKRREAAKSFLDQLDESNGFAYITFNSTANVAVQMTQLTAEKKQQIFTAIDNPPTGNGTDIESALNTAFYQFDIGQTMRNKTVLLLADGDSNSPVDVDGITSKFKKERISIHAVLLPPNTPDELQRAEQLMEDLAAGTDGSFTLMENASDLPQVYEQIRVSSGSHLLYGLRSGTAAYSPIYAALRIAFVALIGIAMAVVIGFLFDSKQLMLNFMIGGVISGVISGVFLEFGSMMFADESEAQTVILAISCILMALMITAFSGVRKYNAEKKIASAPVNPMNMNTTFTDPTIGGGLPPIV